VPFTVSNTSGRAVRGRAILKPENAAGASWLALIGDAAHQIDRLV